MSNSMNRILYIAGSAHCGSTILDIILGAAPGVQSLGQVADLHKNDRCACGATLKSCELWSRVVTREEMPDVTALEEAGQLIRKEKGLLSLLGSSKKRRSYATLQDRVFNMIFEATGQDILIDSSKNFSRALALATASEYDVRVLHLVRDPRGFINSSNKRRSEQDKTNAYLRPMTEWLIKNSIGSAVLQPLIGDSYRQIHYESLLLDPEETLRSIGDFGGFDIEPVLGAVRRGIPFERQHIFAGNRVSTHKSVTFDPSRIEGQQLNGMSNDAFWWSMGWLSVPWGYQRRQRYLNPQSD